MAKVIVTGASGRSGRHVVAALVAHGHEVRALCRTAPARNERTTWIQADLSRPLDYPSLLQGAEAVIHLAAELRQQSQMDAVNVAATRQLAAASHRLGVRYFGYASSIVVYGSPQRRHVDESTPRIDPSAPMHRQYYAEPYMLDYARTKAAAEIAIESLADGMIVDAYRPAVVIDGDDLLAAGGWSTARKIFAAYRRTQFIAATDAAAAVVHLMERGLTLQSSRPRTVSFYNLVDEEGGSYRSLLTRAFRSTGDPRFRLPLDVPVVADMAKDFVRYRNPQIRYPLGMLKISGRRLRDTGFVFPCGMARALDQAIERLRPGALTQGASGLK